MVKIAVDIALLPPTDVMDLVISLNRKLTHTGKSNYSLNKKDWLPHITIAMGIIDTKNLPAIKKELSELFERYPPITISFHDIKNTLNDDDEWSSILLVKKNNGLQELHENIMSVMKKYFSYNATIKMFYAPPTLKRLSPYWKLGYPKTKTYENYLPHLTLGKGKSPIIKLRKTFKSRRLALCHLGKGSTCRKILCEL